jgi:uncharacterized LabA/DUF88 family protein
MTASVQPPLALLIDGENVTPQIAPALLQTAMSLGDPIVRRVYGHTPALVAWKDSGGDHVLTLHHPTGAVAGKNAADIAMVIGAMDLLHRAGIRHFCLVSSDSDFSGLALHLHEAGCTVYGVGRADSPVALRKAYCRFIKIGSLMPAQSPAKVKVKRPAADIGRLIDAALQDGSTQGGRISTSALGIHLRKQRPGFKAKTYGHKTLTKLVQAIGAYEITSANGTNWITPRPVAGSMRH